MSLTVAAGCSDCANRRLASLRSWLLRKAFVLLLIPILLCTLAYVKFHGVARVKTDSEDERKTDVETASVDAAVSQPPSFAVQDLARSFPFSVDGGDVIVFLHMQKTGGTFFGTNLVKNLVLRRECECAEKDTDSMMKCPCRSSDGSRLWLFSRYSVGWKCGLHADWTELHECVDAKMDELENLSRDRRYLYVTMLREPVSRYVSEWQHVARGAHWSAATLRCGGRQPTVDELPFCYSGERWTGVSLLDFVSCEHNLAHNRQTRMLSNLTLVSCYDRSSGPVEVARDAIMLESAKANLMSLAFFGLAEYPNETQRLFEATFGLHFKVDLHTQARRSHYAEEVMSAADAEQLALVHRRTRLDQQLYAYAKALFLARVAYVDSATDDVDRR